MNLSLYVVFNRKCNLHCSWCFQNDFKDGSSCSDSGLENFKTFLDKNPNVKSLTILGGEAFLDGDKLKDLLTFIKNVLRKKEDKFDKVSFITNGTIYFPWLKDFKEIINSIQISIDGGPDSHNMARRYSDGSFSYDVVIKNLNKYYDDGLNVSVNGVISKDSFKNWKKSLNRFYEDIPKDVKIQFSPEHVDNKKQLSTVRNLNVFYKECKKSFKLGKHNKFSFWRNADKTKACSAGSTLLGLDIITGELYSCHERVGDKDYSIGNINSTPIITQDRFDRVACDNNVELYRIQYLSYKFSQNLFKILPIDICQMENFNLTKDKYTVPIYRLITSLYFLNKDKLRRKK